MTPAPAPSDVERSLMQRAFAQVGADQADCARERGIAEKAAALIGALLVAACFA